MTAGRELSRAQPGRPPLPKPLVVVDVLLVAAVGEMPDQYGHSDEMLRNGGVKDDESRRGESGLREREPRWRGQQKGRNKGRTERT